MTYGYIGVFVISLAVNLIPFASPSNMVIAGATTFLLPQSNPLLVGLAVAIASSVAKTGHYYVASCLSAKGGSAQKLASYGKILGRWGALAAFAAAATPVPDDPVVIPLALAHYSPVKFFVAFLAGKTLISVAGAYLGQRVATTFQDLFPSNEYIAITVALSIVIVVALVKLDLSKITLKLAKIIRNKTASD